jgi:hypothetical protein
MSMRAWPTPMLLAAACAAPSAPAPAVPEAGGPAPLCAEWSPPVKVADVDVEGLSEASGLTASRALPGVFFTLEDSGNEPELVAFDAGGRWRGTWTVDGAKNVDWEDLGAGPCDAGASDECLFIADVGDNAATRESPRVYVVRTPALPAGPARGSVKIERSIKYRYPDGARDAESLLVDPATGVPYVVAKRPVPEPNARGVYRIAGLEDADGYVTAVRIGAVTPAKNEQLFTGGAVHPSGRRVLLRHYAGVLEFVLPEGAPFEAFVAVAPRALDEGTAAEVQGEAITYAAEGDAIFTTSEGRRPPLHLRGCAP